MATYASAREQAITRTIRTKRQNESARIDLIGKLDDEYKQARGAGNADAPACAVHADRLEAVAAKCAEIGCPDTASRIRACLCDARRQAVATTL